jgi:two-component system, chemotaxis family, chemotaxis protein CheY
MPAHIYIAEDDPDVRSSIVEILVDEGYDVREFSNGYDPLHALKAGERPCVVLMDLMMPEMNGEEFLAALRLDDDLAAIPVVMITGARMDLPDAEVLQKPFDLTDLVATVAKHCRHSQAQRGSTGAERDQACSTRPSP